MTESANERCPTCGSDDRLFKFQMGCFDRWHDSAAPTAPQGYHSIPYREVHAFVPGDSASCKVCGGFPKSHEAGPSVTAAPQIGPNLVRGPDGETYALVTTGGTAGPSVRTAAPPDCDCHTCTDDSFQRAWEKYDRAKVAGGWEKVAFTLGFGSGWNAAKSDSEAGPSVRPEEEVMPASRFYCIRAGSCSGDADGQGGVMRPPRADLEPIWDEQHNKLPMKQPIEYDLREALSEGINLVESSIAHVSHGGPSRKDAENWLKKAKALFSQRVTRTEGK